MPIYEYQCLDCGKHYELIQKFSDEPLTVCDQCGGQVRKLISATSFVLKGGGWYVTDYASADRKKAMESERPSTEKTASSDKKETKPEAAPGAKADSKKEAVSVE
ncbi:MAG: FmdB family zinc ribbon protein [Dissulfurispiraceae bacterium]